MMGDRQVVQGSLFYEFSIETHVPADHLLRSTDRFVDLAELRAYLAPFYSSTGRPPIDPELMIRMLIVGYCFGIRSERRLSGSGPQPGHEKRIVCSSIPRATTSIPPDRIIHSRR